MKRQPRRKYCPSCHRRSCLAWDVERAVRGAGWVRLDATAHQPARLDAGIGALAVLLAIVGVRVEMRGTFCTRIPGLVDPTTHHSEWAYAATEEPWVPLWVARLLTTLVHASPWALLFAAGYVQGAEDEAQRSRRVGAILTAWEVGQEGAVYAVVGLDGFARTMASVGVSKLLAGLVGVSKTFNLDPTQITAALADGLFSRPHILGLFQTLQKEEGLG